METTKEERDYARGYMESQARRDKARRDNGQKPSIMGLDCSAELAARLIHDSDLAEELAKMLDWALSIIPDNADLYSTEELEKLEYSATLVAKARGET